MEGSGVRTSGLRLHALPNQGVGVEGLTIQSTAEASVESLKLV